MDKPLSQGIASVTAYRFIDTLMQFSFIERIYLFGSRARGDHSPTSDIDLAVECPQATLSEWLKVVEVLEEADTLLKIDCVRLDQVDAAFQKKIREEGKVIYDRQN
ncbi:MAG TPA: nucleotidyltransferase domain-containing protein [Gammaproteobacteria bacterium]|nr:nucleotidyltransferase domain-containing protein [Gammaproteobacteria bacterium]